MTRFTRPMLVCLLFFLMISPAAIALAQTSQQELATEHGTVITVSRVTLLIRTDTGDYKLFELTSDTTRPKAVTPGSEVKVTYSSAASGRDAPRVTIIELKTEAPKGTKPPVADNVPPSVHRLEGQIKRSSSKYHIGVRAGAALDPELILVGVHGQFGPLFSKNAFARPNIEFMFGEVTDIIAINLEGIYRIPSTRDAKWQYYFGAGPAFNFVNKSFNDTTEDFSFSDFTFDAALNILMGMQNRNTFVEFKATAWGEPTIRFIIGYSF